MSETFNVGDKVRWNSSGGHSTGKIVTDKSGDHAMHRGDALQRVD
ncbi:MAG: DUF2945 domain-containing protein [Chloroflexota bacterium]|nr:DUF2945 domain-containing protein [Chloroflexota bacterium]